MKIYEQDPETGQDHKGYSMPEGTHQFIAQWRDEHQLPNLTSAFQDIVAKVQGIPELERQSKNAQQQLEFLQGKASLSGMDLDKPLSLSVQEQASQKANETLRNKELEELRSEVERLTEKLKRKSASCKAKKKRIAVLEAEIGKDKLDVNGIVKDCIRNPQSLGLLISGLKGQAGALQGLPPAQQEDAKEALEFLRWFEERFPEEQDQEEAIGIMALLSSNPANIPVIKQLLNQHATETQTPNPSENDTNQYPS